MKQQNFLIVQIQFCFFSINGVLLDPVLINDAVNINFCFTRIIFAAPEEYLQLTQKILIFWHVPNLFFPFLTEFYMKKLIWSFVRTRFGLLWNNSIIILSRVWSIRFFMISDFIQVKMKNIPCFAFNLHKI